MQKVQQLCFLNCTKVFSKVQFLGMLEKLYLYEKDIETISFWSEIENELSELENVPKSVDITIKT